MVQSYLSPLQVRTVSESRVRLAILGLSDKSATDPAAEIILTSRILRRETKTRGAFYHDRSGTEASVIRVLSRFCLILLLPDTIYFLDSNPKNNY